MLHIIEDILDMVMYCEILKKNMFTTESSKTTEKLDFTAS